jgi:hypothetical protein
MLHRGLTSNNLSAAMGGDSQHDGSAQYFHGVAAVDEIFTEDCVFYEPRGIYRGRDEIDRVAGAIKATHPDFLYQPITEAEELENPPGFCVEPCIFPCSPPPIAT